MNFQVELTGLDNEFVLPFMVSTSRASTSSQRSCRPLSVASKSQKTSDTILANKSIIVWPMAKCGATEAKSVTLRGNGVYKAEISGDDAENFSIFQNGKEVSSQNRIVLKKGTDALITIKFSSRSGVKKHAFFGRVKFVSEENAKMKSTIPLISFLGGSMVSINGDSKKKKLSVSIIGLEDTLKLKNEGSCPTFVYIMPSKAWLFETFWHYMS